MTQQLKTDLTSHRGALLIKGSSVRQREQAAGKLALSLGKRLMRVDLSRIVSKYIGETEKNMERLLSQAQRDGAVLFLDEADALFGKRTRISDAHDRYADHENQLYRIRVHDSGGTVLIGTGQSEDSLARSRAAIALQFKWSRPEARSEEHRKWPP